MKPSSVRKVLLAQAHSERPQPIFLWGPPGVGKSAVTREVGEEMAWPVYDLRMTLLDPTDLRGIPVPHDGVARWLPPSFLPKEGPGILFLDELNAAPPLVQASAYQLVLDRRVGEYVLPEGVIIVAAGNRSGDRAVTHRMPAPLANRFVHLDFDVDLDDWMRWAFREGIAPEVTAFIKFRPELLFAFDPRKEERAFPTPRTWHKVSDILRQGLEREVEVEVLEGAVGAGAAAEFTGFRKVFTELPDPRDILAGKDWYPDHQRTDLCYALTTALAQYAGPEHFERYGRYMLKLPTEFQVVAFQAMGAKDYDALIHTKVFREWAPKNADIIVRPR